MTVKNSRGIIAETYHELQALSLLRAAREGYPLQRASAASRLRAVFQATEIALINLADLMTRAGEDIGRADLNSAATKLSWACGFHRLLSLLSLAPQYFSASPDINISTRALHIYESPGFTAFFEALKRFDQNVKQISGDGGLHVESSLASQSLDSPEFRLLHLARLSNHECTIWEENLSAVNISGEVPSYEEFVGTDELRRAAFATQLSGDTFFTQFRGLHQIPEILGEEANDHIEDAIRLVRAGHLQHAIEQLSCVNTLMEVITASVLPLADNLVTSDYHQIRENLGVTSGSHSVVLHYHMFRDLYGQLWDEVQHAINRYVHKRAADVGTASAIRQIDTERFENTKAWSLHLLFNECLRVRSFIDRWRALHLHLPRNNLGGAYTRSLTGSPDAVAAVRQMRDAAQAVDPMQPLAKARGVLTELSGEDTQPLASYFKSPASLDSQIMSSTGEITQGRFEDVQHRTGIYADKSPFTAPQKRKV